MSSHAATKINQKEYLKKYLSGDKVKKKKKDKHSKKTKVKLLDDDVTFVENIVDEELLLAGEDAPQIVGEVIEEQPEVSIVSKWRSIGIKEEKEESETKPDISDLWGKKSDTKNIKQTQNVKIKIEPRETAYAVSDRLQSLERRPIKKEKLSPDQSPPRLQKEKHDEKSRSRWQNSEPLKSSKHRSISPSRRKHNNANQSTLRNSKANSGQHSDSDNSPPRRRQQESEQSPKRLHRKKSRNNSDSDQSPPRQRKPRLSSPLRSMKETSYPSAQKPRDYEHSSLLTKKENSARKSDSDQSPPRRKRQDSDQSPQRSRQQKSRNYSDSDQSPARRTEYKKNSDSDISPPRQKRNGNLASKKSRWSSADSPTRTLKENTRNRQYFDQSSPRRKQKQSDQSPSRKRAENRRRNNDSDQSPPRQGRGQSPPRRSRKNSDNSPPRKNTENLKRNYDSDQSPPRQRRGQSPPCRKRKNSDQSPPRMRKENLRRNDDSDQSPPRQGRQNSYNSQSRRYEHDSKRDQNPRSFKLEPPSPDRKQKFSDSPPPTHKPKGQKTLDGKKAGLQDAASLKKEMQRRQHEEERMYSKLSNDVSGREAEVQVRSTGRRGKRAQEAEEEDPEARRLKEEREQKRLQKYERWGKGLKQLEEHSARRAAEQHEASKPLARYANDEDLERHLREQERADDPMLEYMRRKKKERQKEEGGEPERAEYKGPFPENRFGIRPGHRWDGVDRSNGYEKKWFGVQTEKQARQEEAYKYSVEDM